MTKATARTVLAQIGVMPIGVFPEIPKTRAEKLVRFGYLPHGIGLLSDDDLDTLNRCYMTEKETAAACGVTRKMLRAMVETKRLPPPYRYLTDNVWSREHIEAELARFSPPMPVAPDDRRLSNQCVYFVQGGALTKIGWAQNARLRLMDLQSGSPEQLKIVAFLPGGGLRQEQLLHAYFAPYRKHGEWFELPAFWREHVAIGGHVDFLSKRDQYSCLRRS